MRINHLSHAAHSGHYRTLFSESDRTYLDLSKPEQQARWKDAHPWQRHLVGKGTPEERACLLPLSAAQKAVLAARGELQ